MSVMSTLNIEAALYNEQTLNWEPLIEPIMDSDSLRPSPWFLTCSVSPVST